MSCFRECCADLQHNFMKFTRHIFWSELLELNSSSSILSVSFCLSQQQLLHVCLLLSSWQGGSLHYVCAKHQCETLKHPTLH